MGHAGGDGHPAGDLFFVVVGDGVALVHAAESLGGAGGVEHGGDQRSLAGVGVAGDYKIANVGAVVNLHGRAPSSVFYRGSLGLAEQEVAGPQTASMLVAISFTTSGAGDASRGMAFEPRRRRGTERKEHLLGEANAALEVGKARVGSHRVKERMYPKKLQNV